MDVRQPGFDKKWLSLLFWLAPILLLPFVWIKTSFDYGDVPDIVNARGFLVIESFPSLLVVYLFILACIIMMSRLKGRWQILPFGLMCAYAIMVIILPLAMMGQIQLNAAGISEFSVRDFFLLTIAPAYYAVLLSFVLATGCYFVYNID